MARSAKKGKEAADCGRSSRDVDEIITTRTADLGWSVTDEYELCTDKYINIYPLKRVIYLHTGRFMAEAAPRTNVRILQIMIRQRVVVDLDNLQERQEGAVTAFSNRFLNKIVDS